MLFLNMAQAIQAVLLANATAATLGWLRGSQPVKITVSFIRNTNKLVPFYRLTEAPSLKLLYTL